MHFIDTHCHLDLYPNYLPLIDKIEKDQIYTIAVTNTPSVFRQSAKLVIGKKYIRTALGLHPQLVAERFKELDLMISLLGETKYIGEIGLDFTTNNKEQQLLQEKIFAAILQSCADYGNKILTIHSRRATSRVIDMIGSSYNGKVIMHWFSGTRKDLERAISYGFYFSINPSMISSDKGRNLINDIPSDRILTESDGPFVKVNGKPISPSETKETVYTLAEFFNCDINQMRDIIYNNFRNILV
jgi:TatD DNase family protein